jgi:hypothetical protein
MREINGFFAIFVVFFFALVIVYFFNNNNNATNVQPANMELRRPLLTENLDSEDNEEEDKTDEPEIDRPEVNDSEIPMMERNTNLDEENQFADQKQMQIAGMNQGMVNDESELPGFSLSNRSTDAYAPVNINVSYNNNRPVSINDFTEQEYGRSLDNYLFDKGFQS